MSDLKINASTGDLDLNSDLSVVDGVDAIAQHLRQRLRTFLGEWFLDHRVGMPYFQSILQKRPNPKVIEAAFQSEILSTPGVLELLSLSLVLNSALRSLSVSFAARVTDGIVVIENLT